MPTRRINPAALPPTIKSLNYLNNILGKIEARQFGALGVARHRAHRQAELGAVEERPHQARDHEHQDEDADTLDAMRRAGEELEDRLEGVTDSINEGANP